LKPLDAAIANFLRLSSEPTYEGLKPVRAEAPPGGKIIPSLPMRD